MCSLQMNEQLLLMSAVVLLLYWLCLSFQLARSYRVPHIPVVSRKLLAELRIQIHGTKNAHTTLRNNDVVLFKLDPPMEGCIRGIGVYQADQTVAPLYCHSEGSSLFSADFRNAMSAVNLNEQRRLLRVVSSDRKGSDFIVEEYLDNDIYVPLLEDMPVASHTGYIIPEGRTHPSDAGADAAEATASTPTSLASTPKAVVAGGLQFLSGILPVSGRDNHVPSDVRKQAVLCVAHLAQTLGGDVRRLCKLTFYLRDIDHSGIVLEVLDELMRNQRVPISPAVTFVGVCALPHQTLIQIDAVALAPVTAV